MNNDNPFKVGDEAIALKSIYGMIKGEVYDITAVADPHVSVMSQDKKFKLHCVYAHRFKSKQDTMSDTKKVELSEEFVLAAHKAACTEWKIKIEKELPKLFEEELFKLGDRIRVNEDEYLIASAGFRKITFVNLKDGNNWNDPIEVSDVNRILYFTLQGQFGRSFVKSWGKIK